MADSRYLVLKARLLRMIGKPRFDQKASPAWSRESVTFEALESRLLLSADLTGAILSSTLPAGALPGDTGAAVVDVSNRGNTSASADIRVDVYASLDNVLDSHDRLLGTQTAANSVISPAKNKSITVPLLIPADLVPGSYRMLSVIDPQNAVKESNESNNVANGAGFQLNWKFGTVPGHSGSTPRTLRDTDGTDVAFSLSGPGSGQVTLQGAQWNVLLTGVTSKSTFLVKTNSGGDGRVRLNDIRIAGSLDSLSAPTSKPAGPEESTKISKWATSIATRWAEPLRRPTTSGSRCSRRTRPRCTSTPTMRRRPSSRSRWSIRR